MGSAAELAIALVDLVFVKTTIVLLVAGAGARSLGRNASAVARVWLCALIAIALLPVLVSAGADAETVAWLPVVEFPHTLLPYPRALLAIWLVGALAGVAAIVRDERAARRLVGTATPPSAPMQRIVARILAESGTATSVRVCMSPGIESPAMHGWRTVTILLPTHTIDWSRRDLAAALRHELAHVRRRDWLVRVAERALVAILWPNPLLRLAFRRASLHRELAADREALGTSGHHTDVEAYTRALLRVARRSRAVRAPVAAVAFSATHGLAWRIHALLDEPEPCRSAVQGNARRRAATLAVAGTALLLSHFTLWVCLP